MAPKPYTGTDLWLEGSLLTAGTLAYRTSPATRGLANAGSGNKGKQQDAKALQNGGVGTHEGKEAVPSFSFIPYIMKVYISNL